MPYALRPSIRGNVPCHRVRPVREAAAVLHQQRPPQQLHRGRGAGAASNRVRAIRPAQVSGLRVLSSMR